MYGEFGDNGQYRTMGQSPECHSQCITQLDCIKFNVLQNETNVSCNLTFFCQDFFFNLKLNKTLSLISPLMTM